MFVHHFFPVIHQLCQAQRKGWSRWWTWKWWCRTVSPGSPTGSHPQHLLAWFSLRWAYTNGSHGPALWIPGSYWGAACYEQVASRLGTEEGKIQLRLGNVANGGAGEVPRDRGPLVDVMDSAGDFRNRVIHAVVVAWLVYNCMRTRDSLSGCFLKLGWQWPCRSTWPSWYKL